MESSELYIVPATDGDMVKVRGGLMDVKHLHAVDADGLEQWSPVMKAPFPLASSDVDAVLVALGVEPVAPLERAAYSWAEVLAEVIEPHPGLMTVEVHKERGRFTLDGCTAELTRVTTPYGSTRTVAVESENAEQVVAAVRRIGLLPRPNVNYARALRVLARFGVERCAVIDVGTNSVKFHIGERGTDGAWRTVVDRAEVTRLGDGLDETGRLKPEPIARTAAAVAGMVEEARTQRVAAIAAVGTAWFRIAPNGRELVDEVQARCGVEVEVISGEDEAGLAYLAAVDGLGLTGHGSRVVFDTGGGSSQFTFGDGDQVEERFSVDVGAVRFTEQFALDGPVSPDVLDAALKAIEQDLGRLDGRGDAGDPGGPGRCADQPRRRSARVGDVRPGRRAGDGARHRRDRPADRAVPHPHRRPAPRGRRPAARARGGDPGWCVHRADRPAPARQGLARRQ